MKTSSQKKKNFFFKDKMKNLGYLPRWIILAIDFSFVILSIFIGGYLLDGIGLHFYPQQNPLAFYSLFLGFHLIYFWYFQTFAGIIRHTNIVDAIRLFWAELAVLFTLFVINTFNHVITGQKLFLSTRLLVYTIISYALLLIFRIVVKSVFENYINHVQDNNLLSTVIYGSDERALAIANAIMTESPKRFRLIGFIDTKNTSAVTQSRLLNLPFYNTNRRIPVVARKMGAHSVILAVNDISNEEKMQIIDDCLNYNIKVYNLPLLSDLSNQKSVAANIRNIKIQDLLERNPIVLNNKNIKEQIQGKTVLVSGGAGSIGSEIVWQISKFNPKEILILDQAETPLHHISLEIEKNSPQTKIVPLIADIRNTELLEQIFQKHLPDVVYHAAAYKHVPLMEENPEQAIFTNVMGTKNLADLAVKYNTTRFVMVSTDKAVNPSNIMGASKRIAEKYVQSFNSHLVHLNQSRTKFITTRFGNVLGSNGSVVPLFTKQIEQGGPITITHPDIIRYFMTIPEACQLVLEAGSMGNGGEIYIFDMGKPVKIIDLARKMIKLAGLIPDRDIAIKVVGLRPGEKLYEELLNDTSTTLPTHHEKIMVAQDQHELYEELLNELNALYCFAQKNDTENMVKTMKQIVPEFKSLNSVYEKFDKEN